MKVEIKNYLPMNLQTFSEELGSGEPTGVEVDHAADDQIIEGQTGEETTTAAESPPPNNFEKAFAKRLAAEREKWEADRQKELERYKDYDALKKVTEYVQKSSGFDDVMTLKEQIELAELQERAEQHNVPPEVMKRIEELESKAQKADEYEQQQAHNQHYQTFRSNLETFAQSKGVEADHLHQFMYENQISNPEIAFKAMKAEELETKVNEREQDIIKRYLESKKAPTVEGSGPAGVVEESPTTDWKQARQRAMERIRASLNQN